MARSSNVWAKIDWVTVLLFFILVFLGWINIYASLYNDSHQSIFDVSQRYGKQLIWIGAAVVIAVIILLIETNFYVFFSYIIYAFFIFLLIAVLIFGKEINGAKSWFLIGEFGFQPSEFAKFATALVLARFMSSFGFRIHQLSSLSGIALIISIPLFFIILQNDTGSALVFFSFILVFYREGLSEIVLFTITLLILIFILALVLQNLTFIILLTLSGIFAYLVFNPKMKEFWRVVIIFFVTNLIFTGLGILIKGKVDFVEILTIGAIVSSIIIFVHSLIRNIKKYITVSIFFLAVILFSISVEFVFNKVLEPHHQARINELLGIHSDPKGIGYTVNQSKIAIGSGGFLGKGFLEGTQTKFNFVPAQSTDFIFCTVGEEWGFVGSITVIGLFLFLLIRLVVLAERQRSRFSRIYGYSVATIIFFHFLVNIGMTMGIMPVIGIPLPFFSYGGSSLWSFTILLFIFIRLDASRLEHLSD